MEIQFASYKATRQDWYDIACAIDCEFRGSIDTFSHKRDGGMNYLTTNLIDGASFISIHTDRDFITMILRNGPDTEGWKEIHPEVYNIVKEALS